jgi:uncharacterized protein YaeQ
MALKATIFKAELAVADMDRGYYADHSLTLARHPSETDERMMVRLVAFALNASDALKFGGGLSTEDEPALWAHDLTGAIDLWIDVGLPDAKELRRACGRAKQVKLYTYGGRAVPLWWQASRETLERSNNLAVVDLAQESTKGLAALALRTMRIQCSIQDGIALVSDGQRAVEVSATTLMAPG